MLPQSDEAELNPPSSSTSNHNTKQLDSIFEEMSTTSEAVNVVAVSPPEKAETFKPKTIFESLEMLTKRPEEHVVRKKARFTFHEPNFYENTLSSPDNNSTRWLPLPPFQFPFANPIYIPPQDEPFTDEQLVKMKGPSRLIGFLVHIAMDERSRRALRWTGNGLEFILVNKELVAKMWGNRKHNTKDMDYYKLSRAIREKYDKKENNIITKAGKLKKGTRTYSYVFTEHSFPDLRNQTDKSIEEILKFAADIGIKYHDNNDINNSNSPQAQSPQNSD